MRSWKPGYGFPTDIVINPYSHAHDVLTAFMSNHGFTVTRHFHLPTAWRATFSHGEGGRTVGVNSEVLLHTVDSIAAIHTYSPLAILRWTRYPVLDMVSYSIASSYNLTQKHCRNVDSLRSQPDCNVRRSSRLCSQIRNAKIEHQGKDLVAWNTWYACSLPPTRKLTCLSR